MNKAKDHKANMAEKRFTEFAVEEIEGVKVFVASDETVDREGEVLSADGWQLDNFKRNPVMLWAHNPFEPPIGKWKNIRMRTVDGKKKLTMEPDFHRKSELSKLIADLVEGGYPPQTVSVGFRPFEKQGNVFTKQELLETSFVNIPANPEATQLALSRGFNEHAVKALTGEEDASDSLKVSQELEGEEPASQEEVTALRSEVATLKSTIEKLEVKLQQLKPVNEHSPRSVQGRKSDTRKHNITALLRSADKAIENALRLSKENNHG